MLEFKKGAGLNIQFTRPDSGYSLHQSPLSELRSH